MIKRLFCAFLFCLLFLTPRMSDAFFRSSVIGSEKASKAPTWVADATGVQNYGATCTVSLTTVAGTDRCFIFAISHEDASAAVSSVTYDTSNNMTEVLKWTEGSGDHSLLVYYYCTDTGSGSKNFVVTLDQSEQMACAAAQIDGVNTESLISDFDYTNTYAADQETTTTTINASKESMIFTAGSIEGGYTQSDGCAATTGQTKEAEVTQVDKTITIGYKSVATAGSSTNICWQGSSGWGDQKHIAMALNPAGLGDLCTISGCTEGTYNFCWTGEYPNAPEVACLDSGTRAVNLSADNGSVIGTGGAINGDYGALLDAGTDVVEWPFIGDQVSDVDDSGTVRLYLTTPSSFSSYSTVWGLYSGTDTADNNAQARFDDDEKSTMYHEGSADGDYSGPTSAAVVASTTYTLCFSWKTSDGDVVCSSEPLASDDSDCSGVTWGGACNASAITAPFNDVMKYFQLGSDCDSNGASGDGACQLDGWFGSTGWKIDDVYIYDGYQGP